MSPRAIFGGLAVALLAVTGLIAQKEWLIRRGEPLLLQLAPRDPRSILQGDYMDLEYAIGRAVSDADLERDGKLVLKVDADHVGTFVRLHSGEALALDERLLRYRVRGSWRRLRIGAEAFFFQEGTAERYESAKYGELRVTSSGDAVLVGLCDEARRPLGVGLR